MIKRKVLHISIFAALLSFTLFIFSYSGVLAVTSGIDITIKAGLCGDSTIDSGENCEPGPPEKLGGATCTTKGFDNGTLGCNIDCTFDTSSCTNNTPPAPTGGGGGGGGGSSALFAYTPTPEAVVLKGDLNNDGQVNLIDFSIVAYWYNRTLSAAFSQKETERMNGDGKVDLVDFSIMAFYWTG